MDYSFATCPFNPQHRMLKLRLQHHIVKCQKNYLTAGMKPCPYNATHIIAKDNYREHIQTCPDFVLIEGSKYEDIHQVHGKLNDGAFHYDLVQDESWKLREVDDTSDSCSQISESDESKDNSQGFDWLNEYDEDEEPLQRYLYEKTKSKSLTTSVASGSATSEREKDFTGERHSNGDDLNKEGLSCGRQFGAGRGRLLSILASLQK